MKEKGLKYIFISSSLLLLILMLLLSRNAGITCDEILHYDHSVAVYNYFASHGADKSALNTPVTNLKYYGQSYDNMVTILIKWFNIDNVYGFRHIMSSISGWLTILVTALFAIWLTDYRTGILVLFLFAISPTFFGHTQNNLKDIPFALGYITTTFFTLRFLVSGKKNSYTGILLLTAGIAFTVSIRAGGLVLLCYLFFFFFIFYFLNFIGGKKIDIIEVRIKLLWMLGITIAAWFLSIILWPFALQKPISNMIASYRVMAHFPSTFRQIFEGRVEWSDFMPWYYIPKSIIITVPIIVTAGLILFGLFSGIKFKSIRAVLFGFVLFTIVFPIVFVIFEQSNTYSSWRQFLFIYPAVVLLSAVGFISLSDRIKSKYLKWAGVLLMLLFSLHPLKYMMRNPQFYYLYYNQLTGGLKGAYSNYETDYYYVSQTAASKWLIEYLKDKKTTQGVKVKATYSVAWLFRKYPEIETSYFRYEERSQTDWDYAIVSNRYIPPYQLRKGIWPPKNSIHIVYADDVPVCAILERKTREDYLGYVALNEGRNVEACEHFEKALRIDDQDEMIFYNFGAALYKAGRFQKADSMLRKGLELNPDFEPILMYLGNIARTENKTEEAIEYYDKLIRLNRKYFEAYVAESELLIDRDLIRARSLLRTCLNISPYYKPAISALADTYRKTDPDIAKKYDELAGKIN